MGRRKLRLRVAARLAAKFVAATAAAGLLIEAGLRLFPSLAPDRLQLECLRSSLSASGFSSDPEMGVVVSSPHARELVLRGRRVRLRHVPFPGESKIGYRAGAEGRDPTKVDIAVLGDSHAYGLEVDEDETWESRLSGLTGLSVSNLALPYQGTTQEMILYRHYGVRSHPKLVLMMVCPNDLWDNKVFLAWTAQRRWGDVDLRYYTFRVLLGWPDPLFTLARWANKSILLRELLVRPYITRRYRGLRGTSDSPEDLAALVADVTATQTLAAAGGARFGVILTDLWWWKSYRLAADRLKEALRRRGIPVLDLALHLCEESGCPSELILPYDYHWNPSGHARVAEEAQRFLIASHLLPSVSYASDPPRR